MESINDYQEREPRRQTAFGRWGQTILGHFPFHAGIALLQSLSFLHGAACIYLYGRLGGALLLAAGALLFQGLMDWFFNYVLLRGSEPWYMLLHLTLPNALYTLILSPLLYGLTRLIAHILRKRE